jgi:hypothetical protein
MQGLFTGTIIEESLTDSRLVNDLEVVKARIGSAENPADRWHLYTVRISRPEIEKLAACIRPGRWYMHFWNEDRHVIAVFANRVFEFEYGDKSTWEGAVGYGRSIGIPEEQLDFLLKE